MSEQIMAIIYIVISSYIYTKHVCTSQSSIMFSYYLYTEHLLYT